MWTSLTLIAARVRAFFRSRGLDRDFEEELQAHLALLAAEYSRRGMTPAQASRAARLALGGVAQLREAHRETRGLPLLEAMLRDMQYALRALRRSPGFAVIATLTLALGIGVNTAIFTAYNAVALRPIQARDPGRLVQVTRSTRDQFFSYPDYVYYRDNNRTFSEFFAVGFGTTLSLGGVDKPAAAPHGNLASVAGFRLPQTLAGSAEQVGTVGVSGNYFKALGVAAVLGRTFLPEEDAAGAPAVALISQHCWERRFASDPNLLGRTLTLNHVAVTIIGVTPRDFTGTWPNVPDLWMPLALQARLTSRGDPLHDRNAVCCRVYGRLAPNIPMRQAEAEMNALRARLELASPGYRAARQTGQFVLKPPSPFGPADSGASTLAVYILAAVSLVLLIACANVASMLLARSAARQKEIAIRLAIGASRGRLIRQLLTENAVISLLAGGVGIAFSWWSLSFLIAQVVAALPSYWSIAVRVAPDLRVLAYTLFLSTAATLACGLAPALEASRPNLTSALKDEGAAFGGRLRKSRLRDLMVGAQVAVCLALLIAAGMLARTSQKALAVDLGFNYRNVVMLHLWSPDGATPGKLAAIRAQVAQLARQLAGLPEIESVSFAGRLPLAGGIRTIAVALEGGTLDDPGAPNVFYNLVAPGYFSTMGIPILRGRDFTAPESRADLNFDGSPVIVSAATVRRLWPGQDAIGKRVAFGPGRRSSRFAGEVYPQSAGSVVVGVAGDVRSVSLEKVDDTCLYFPASTGAIVMRARQDEDRAMAAIQRVFQSSHSDLEAEVLDSRTAFSNQAAFVLSRVGAIGSAMIGLLGLLMASVGIHGTVSFAVTQRTQEIGIRMALGARRGDVLRLVLFETMRPVAIGLTVGFALAAIVSRLMAAFLFGLSPLDPVAFLGASGFLATVAFLAGYIPARRSTNVDPMLALRHD